MNIGYLRHPMLPLLLAAGVLAACQQQPATDQSEPAHEHAEHAEHAGHEHHAPDHAHPAPEQQPSIMDRALPGGEQALWTCPMHPQIVRDEPGRCPICGMALVERTVAAGAAPGVTIAPGVQQQMNLRTATVERGRLWRRIDTVGRIQVDESGLHHLHPRVEGWIDELAISAAGDRVRAGQQLFTLYAPELVNVQEELLQALAGGRPAMASASRERLRALDVQPTVIERIERERRVITHMPWYARHDGYVAVLNVRHGMYVTPGLEMISIANPETVWLIADVFGGQIEWLDEGQTVHLQLASQPEREFRGRVDLIYPELDPVTRAARARIVLDNIEGDLRPGDWGSLSVFAGPRDDQLIIPGEALIRTGLEQRVVVRDDDSRFSIRPVRAGMESGGLTAIVEGLHEGEEVVVSGQFLIDSEASLRAGHDRLGGQHSH